jgi:hypothetical protein
MSEKFSYLNSGIVTETKKKFSLQIWKSFVSVKTDKIPFSWIGIKPRHHYYSIQAWNKHFTFYNTPLVIFLNIKDENFPC